MPNLKKFFTRFGGGTSSPAQSPDEAGMIVSLTIILTVAIAFLMGYRRGFIVVAAKLIGFILASIIAGVLYRSIITFVSKSLHLLPSFAGIVAFVVIFTVVEIIYFVSIRWLLRRVSPKLLRSQINRFAGCLLNGLKALTVISILLILIKGLPIRGSDRDRITSAAVPKGLLHISKPLQGMVDYIFAGTITSTVNFFAVKPDSNVKIDLDFRTVSVRDDDAKAVLMLDMINHERSLHGLSRLRPNPAAATVAKSHARDMFAKGYFSHNNLEGQNPFDRLKQGGVKYIAAGENLALAPTLSLAHNGLMNSPPHRANILSIDYGTVGIGIVDGGRYGLMIAQEFTD